MNTDGTTARSSRSCSGFDDPDPDDPDDEPDPDAPDDPDDPDDEDKTKEPPKKKAKHNSHQRPERQAARYRVERNEARVQRDEARLELAFAKAAGGRFVNLDAAWKLVDRTVLSLDPDGVPVGLDEAIEALAESNPFLLTDDDEAEPEKEQDPFARSSGRTMNGKKKPLATGLSRSALAKTYPALGR